VIIVVNVFWLFDIVYPSYCIQLNKCWTTKCHCPLFSDLF